MPIYRYKCAKCGNTDEFMIGVTTEDDVVKCAECKSAEMERVYTGVTVLKEKSSAVPGGCCGSATPCDDPSRCCGR